MYYVREDRADFDARETLGNSGWNWDTLFSNFRSENFTIPSRAQRRNGMTYIPRNHGESGPLKVGFTLHVDNGSFHNSAQETCASIGFPLNQDLNGGEVRGFGAFPQTLDRDANVRETSARTYYDSVGSRPNLQIIKGTVKRIVLSNLPSKKLLATGFEYTDVQGNLKSITARKEVILSAGTFASPLILEASGIGNSMYV